MRPRFVALINRSARPAGEAARTREGATDPLVTVCDLGWAWLAMAGSTPIHLHDGAIFGSLFRKGEAQPVVRLDAHERTAIEQSGGATLIERFWGGYVAILFDAGRRRATVVRAPFGELPCLFAQTTAGLALASDMRLLDSVTDRRPSVDAEAIARRLAIRDIRTGPTCLAGVGELHGGERLQTTPDLTVETLWTPWRHARRDAQFRTVIDAVAAVRAATLETVAARSAPFARSVLMLSGGLDSSIVAAALAHAGHEFDCLTLTTRDLAGDESGLAALASDAVGRQLHIVVRNVASIDVNCSDAAGLPQPSARAFAQVSRRAASEIAATIGADAIVTGGGGDNVFCSVQSGSPAADRLLVGGPGPAFLRAVRDMSIVASASLWEVGRDAINRALRDRPTRRRADLRLLSADAGAVAQTAPSHNWCLPPRGTLPGTAAHARLLVYAQSFMESMDPCNELPHIAPLLGQPLVETCLRIPSWLWFEGSRNRSVARRAFSPDLPPAIIDRRSKGSPESFVAEIFDRNREALADLLRGGWLWSSGVIDRAELERVLDDPRPAHGTDFMRLLELADVEAWVRSWR